MPSVWIADQLNSITNRFITDGLLDLRLLFLSRCYMQAKFSNSTHLCLNCKSPNFKWNSFQEFLVNTWYILSLWNNFSSPVQMVLKWLSNRSGFWAWAGIVWCLTSQNKKSIKKKFRQEQSMNFISVAIFEILRRIYLENAGTSKCLSQFCQIWDRIVFMASLWCFANSFVNRIYITNMQREKTTLLHLFLEQFQFGLFFIFEGISYPFNNKLFAIHMFF